MKPNETFFEFSSFHKFRTANLESITHSKIHDKYKEIRDIMGLIKDYNSDPSQLSTFEQRLTEIETPPHTPQRPKHPKSHFPSLMASKDLQNSSKTKNSKNDSSNNSNKKQAEESFKHLIQGLEAHLAENLEETKDLKQMFMQSQLKNQSNVLKISYLDALQETSDIRKISESSFGKINGFETIETPSPGGKLHSDIKETKEKQMGVEISQAERRVYELQSQRFLNKIQDLNKKNIQAEQELKISNEKLEKFKEFFTSPKVVGKIGFSRQYLKENIKSLSKEQTLLQEYENFWVDVDVESMRLFKDNEFTQLSRTIPWGQIQEISTFEKEDEPLIGIFVLKIKENENIEPEFRIMKPSEANNYSWEMFFLGFLHKIQSKNNEFIHLLRRNQLKNLFLKENLPKNPENNKNEPPKESPKLVRRGLESVKPLKSIKNSNFNQLAHTSGLKKMRKERLLQTASSKSLQPQRQEDSFQNNSNENKYQSTYEFISSKFQPFGMSDSLLRKGVIDSYDNQLKALNILKNGFVFMKYGKYGDPHERLLMLSNCEKKIEWRAINKKTASSIEIDAIKDVKEGRNSTIFAKHKAKTQEQTLMSFSIYYLNGKTLDLEANNQENKQKFLWSLGVLVKKAKQNVTKNKNGMISQPKRIVTEDFITNKKSFKSSKNASMIEGVEGEEGSEKE